MPQSKPFPATLPRHRFRPAAGRRPLTHAGPRTSRRAPRVLDTPPDLPGCVSFPMTYREFERNEERFEFWNAPHRDRVEGPRAMSRCTARASALLDWPCSRAGSRPFGARPIECFGSVSLDPARTDEDVIAGR